MGDAELIVSHRMTHFFNELPLVSITKNKPMRFIQQGGKSVEEVQK